MEAAVSAARWVVGKALGPVTDGLLEAWAASAGLGPNIEALKMELLYAQAMLSNTRGREVHNPALNEMLQKLRQLAYDADDVLDELEYFRIQDQLDGTYHAAGEHDGGCVRNHALIARHTAKAIGKMLAFSSCSCSASRGDRDEPSDDTKGVFCGAWPCRGQRTPNDEPEGDARRGLMCGIAWPWGGQSTSATISSPPPTNQDDHKEVDKGCMQKLASGARNTISIVGKRLPCYSVSPVPNDPNSSVACRARPNKAPRRERVIKAPKLEFNRVEISKRMKEIVEQLKPVCAKVNKVLSLELLDSNRSIAQSIATSLDAMSSEKQGRAPSLTNSVAMSRPITTSEFIGPEFYGRKDETSKIIYDITKGEYCDKDLTVLPIVGPGGIGKTTLTQYLYKELQKHFEVTVWVCVSVNFNVYRLTQEIADSLANDDKSSPDKLIEERINSKKFLLVLDDMWNCSGEDEWKRLLMPFTKGRTKGNMILVTSRFPAVAQMVKTTNHQIDLEGLDCEAFKELFLACVFGDKKSINDHNGLLETGEKIVKKLKGSPLAAKTVGRLLKNHLDLDHWIRVLESKEWESQNGDHDIMPALKLSYDYLPFHLQQCFTYCALFPEDYRYEREELIQLWIGLDFLQPHFESKSIEDIGVSYLTELVNNGFFKREEKKDGTNCYVIHDLLHELALKVSSHECLSIDSSNVRSIQIPPSIRHLSITIDNTSVKDRMTFNNCVKDLSTLDKRLKFENIRSLMLFGGHHGSFVKTFGSLFREAKALRVVILSHVSYNVADLFHNFYNLVHLRYLRIQRLPGAKAIFPYNISRFYHLMVLDWKRCDPFDLPRDMSNLIKLRHFLVRDEMHASIFEVGRLKSLHELRRFVVKKESQGFELGQIGHLVELCGSLCIDNLEKVEKREEADEAKLMQKNRLHGLILRWDTGRSTKDSAQEELVLENLKPSSNLLELSIKGHGGATCPSWIGANLSIKNLESLCLDGVSWKIFPPVGDLLLVNEQGEELSCNISDKKFHKLRRLELVKLQRLKQWIGDGPCQLFPHLEVLIIRDCSELTELSLSHSTCCQREKEDNRSWFPRLQALMIDDCPKLLSFPPIPWTKAPCFFDIRGVGSVFESLACYENYDSGYSLQIKVNDTNDSTFWNALAFHNLAELKLLEVTRFPPLPLRHFQMLSSLKTLNIQVSSNVFLLPEGECSAQCQFPMVERVCIHKWGASGKELTQLLTHFPELSELEVRFCEKITGLGVVEQQATSTLASSSSASKLEDEAQVEQHQQQDARGEEEIAASAAEGLLLLPPQLQKLQIVGCPELSLRSNPLDDDKEAGRTGGGGWLQGLSSLRLLQIEDCPKFLSSYSSSSSSFCFPFPNSLEDLLLRCVEGMALLLPVSNLRSLTSLSIWGCGDLRCEGLWTLLAEGHLAQLTVHETPNFFAGSEPSRPHEQETPSRSPKLQYLRTDDVAGVLAAPICTLLSSSLTELNFWGDKEVERFTPEQEEALQSLTSLEGITFCKCDKLQCIPAGLHRLPNLRRLNIFNCAAIRSLPKDGLPSSLQELEIHKCPAIPSLPKDCLPNSLQTLVIRNCRVIPSLPKDGLPNSLQELVISQCPAMKSLPKVEDLPSSLRVLDVRGSESEELRRQCRKLIGTIPIVYA